MCREASEKSPRAFWAFRRLGYLQVLIYLPIYLFLFYVDINRLIDLWLLSIRHIKRNGLKLYKVFNMPFGAILPALSYGKYVFYGSYICSCYLFLKSSLLLVLCIINKLCFLCVRLWVLLTSVWAGSLLLLRYLMLLDLFNNSMLVKCDFLWFKYVGHTFPMLLFFFHSLLFNSSMTNFLCVRTVLWASHRIGQYKCICYD